MGRLSIGILLSVPYGWAINPLSVELTQMEAEWCGLFAGSSAGAKGQGLQFFITRFFLWAAWFTLGIISVSQK